MGLRHGPGCAGREQRDGHRHRARHSERRNDTYGHEGGACPPFNANFGAAEWHSGIGADQTLRIADLRLLQAKLRRRHRVADNDSALMSAT